MISLRTPLRSFGRRATFARAGESNAKTRVAARAAWGPRIASLLFAGLLVQAAVGVWRAGAPAAEVLPVVPEFIATAAPGVDVALIIERHLFGQPDAGAQAEQAPQSRANLVLGGTWHEGEGGYAVIGELGGRQRPYRTGDRLPGGAQLAEIHADRVLIRREGRSETLFLPRGPSAAEAGPASANPLLRRYR